MRFLVAPCSPSAVTVRRVAAAVVAVLLWSGLVARPLRAITIELDYSEDESGLFGTAEAPTPARIALEFAVRAYEPFMDSLSAIQPGGGDNWTARTFDPSTGGLLDVANLAVVANTLHVFAGFRDLPGAELGNAGPGTTAMGPTGSPAFVNAVLNRGQGSTAVDFAPWGGFIAFDTTTSVGDPRPWHFDLNSPPPAGTYDLYTVAVHELGHMMGFGLATSFLNQVNVGTHRFTGTTAAGLYGDDVPLATSHQHWDAFVTSPPYAGVQPKPSYGPTLAAAERKTLTPLDYAALADTGWIVPEELLGLHGDVDDDDDVDGEDLLVWQRSLGGVGVMPGDANGDSTVDDYDGWLIRRNFGAIGALPGAVAASAAVPEPASLALAFSLLAALGLNRQRR